MKRILVPFLFIVCISCSENSEDIIEDNSLNEKSTEQETVQQEESEDEEPAEEENEVEEKEIDVDLPQKWILYKYLCCENVETSGDEMELTLNYYFNKDKRFERILIRENDTIEGMGDFKVIESDNGLPVYKLQFDEFDHSVHSCNSREKENLYISEEDDNILINDLRACDGPMYFYEQ